MIHILDTQELLNRQKDFNPTKKSNDPVYLMLDIDGVLHPFEDTYKPDASRRYTKVHYLTSILERLPNVTIIISSSKARHTALDELKKKFPESIRNRFIGSIKEQTDNRHNDVIKFMEERFPMTTVPWIAVDDLAFYPSDDPVVWVDWKTGLTDETANILYKALSSPKEFISFKKGKIYI
jgi:hypothetical protein